MSFLQVQFRETVRAGTHFLELLQVSRALRRGHQRRLRQRLPNPAPDLPHPAASRRRTTLSGQEHRSQLRALTVAGSGRQAGISVDHEKRNAKVRPFMHAFTAPQPAARRNRLIVLIKRNRKRPV